MKQIFFSLLLFFACTHVMSAQQKMELRFDETEYDFGAINEEHGSVSHTFRFVNSGTSPLTIERVTASCGCTTPEWTQNAILPNEIGEIKVTFDPEERPGNFQKAVRVVFSGDGGNFSETLDIKGFVVPRAETLSEAYPYHFGDVALKGSVVEFDTINKGETGEVRLNLANLADEPLHLIFDAPDYIVIDAPAILKPHEETFITLKYLSHLSDAWGFSDSEILISANEKSVGKFIARAILVEDFSKLTQAERLSAPIAVIAPKILDLGELKIGKKYSETLNLTNAGIDALQVRAISLPSDYISAKSQKSVVKSGKSTKIKVTIDATNLQPYTFSKTLQVITNDPTNPTQTFVVIWKTVRK